MTIAVETDTAGRPAEPFATRVATDTVRLERLLPGPVERVWTYLTDSDLRAKWLAEGPIEGRVGGAISFTWRNDQLAGGGSRPEGRTPEDGIDNVMHGIVTAYDPPRLLAFNWQADGMGSESVIELAQEGPNTRLTVTQRRVASPETLFNMTCGWHVHLGVLVDLVADLPPRPFWPEFARLREVYTERFAG